MASSREFQGLEIIAHRGASGYVPENTLAAFSKAIEMGAESVEFDVQQTQEGELVVIHDPNLHRVAGVRKSIGKMKYAQLADIDVGSWFQPRFHGERVPRLAAVLDLLGGAPSPIEIQLEIKHGIKPYRGIERRILELLSSRRALEKRVVFSSFNHRSLRRVRELAPKARLGFLAGAKGVSASVREASSLRCESVHIGMRRADRGWASAVHAAGMKLLVYTVNTRQDLKRLFDLGVDGVFSNFPDIAGGKPLDPGNGVLAGSDRSNIARALSADGE